MMKKIFIIIILYFANFTLAQNYKMDSTKGRMVYCFDISVKTTTTLNQSPGTKTKYINSKNDDYFAVSFGEIDFTLFDVKNKIMHAFKKLNSEGSFQLEYISSTKNEFEQFRKVKVKKIGKHQYQLTKPYKNAQNGSFIAIVKLEESKFDAANSLDINDVINLDVDHLEILRRKEKHKPFIIRSYQTITSYNEISYGTVSDEKKINIQLILPKTLKIYIPEKIKVNEFLKTHEKIYKPDPVPRN